MSEPDRPLQTVAVIVQDGVEPFGLGSLVEVWGEPCHPEDDVPTFDFRVCTPRPGRVRGRSDFDLYVERGLEATEDADLVCIAPKAEHDQHDPAVLDALRAAHERGAIVYAHCSGAFELAAAGLLDGREATTHWRYSEEFPAAYPQVRLLPDVLYVQSGTIITGAGSAAGIDASLHLMREKFGARVAATTARRIVVPPHRDGGQAQFITRQVVDCQSETLGEVLGWALENLHLELEVTTLAERAHMSPRTFARRFRDELGTTPHAWVTQQRLALAEEMLERTGNSVDQIATDAGFGNASALRHHFTRARGVSPAVYRRRFTVLAPLEHAQRP